MRRVDLNITVHMIVDIDEGVEVSAIVDELDYQFSDTTTKATVIDTEITKVEVTDSR